MSEKRTRRHIGRIQQVFFPNGKFPYGAAHYMMAVPEPPGASGSFFFDGKNVHFHEADLKYEKEIIYESVEQVQRTTRGSLKVRLRL